MASSFKTDPTSLLDEKHLLQLKDYPSEDEIFIFDYVGAVYSLYCTGGNIYMRPVGGKSNTTTTVIAAEATKFGVVRFGQYLVIACASGSKREAQKLVKIDLDDGMTQETIDSVSISGLTDTGFCPAVAQDPTDPDKIVWICGLASSAAEIAAGTPHFSEVQIRAGTIVAASFTTIETYEYGEFYEPAEAAICVNPGGSFCYFLKYNLNDDSYGSKILFGDCLDVSNPPKVKNCTPAAATDCTWAYDSTDECYLLTSISERNAKVYLTELAGSSVDYLGFSLGDTVQITLQYRTYRTNNCSPMIYHGWCPAPLSVESFVHPVGATKEGTSGMSWRDGISEVWSSWKTVSSKHVITQKNPVFGIAVYNPAGQASGGQVIRRRGKVDIEIKNIYLSRPKPTVGTVTKSRYKADMAVGTGTDTTPNALFPDTERLFSSGIFSDAADVANQVRFADATPVAEDATVAPFGVVRQKATIIAAAQKAGVYYKASMASGTITPTALASFPKSGLTDFTADVAYVQFPAAPLSTGLYERNSIFFRLRNSTSSGQSSLCDLVCAMYAQVGG